MIRGEGGQAASSGSNDVLQKHEANMGQYLSIRDGQVMLLKAKANTAPSLVLSITAEAFAETLTEEGVPADVAKEIAELGLNQAQEVARLRLAAAEKFHKAKLRNQ